MKRLVHDRKKCLECAGCVGVCRLEPIVEVYVKGQEKVTYVHMTPEKVARVVNKPGYSGGGAADLGGLGLFGALAVLATLRRRRVG